MVSCKICKGFGYYEDNNSHVKTCLCLSTVQELDKDTKTLREPSKIVNINRDEYISKEKN